MGNFSVIHSGVCARAPWLNERGWMRIVLKFNQRRM
jgi:hypothetical protein